MSTFVADTQIVTSFSAALASKRRGYGEQQSSRDSAGSCIAFSAQENKQLQQVPAQASVLDEPGPRTSTNDNDVAKCGQPQCSPSACEKSYTSFDANLHQLQSSDLAHEKDGQLGTRGIVQAGPCHTIGATIQAGPSDIDHQDRAKCDQLQVVKFLSASELSGHGVFSGWSIPKKTCCNKLFCRCDQDKVSSTAASSACEKGGQSGHASTTCKHDAALSNGDDQDRAKCDQLHFDKSLSASELCGHTDSEVASYDAASLAGLSDFQLMDLFTTAAPGSKRRHLIIWESQRRAKAQGEQPPDRDVV